jgi:LacI family transcriptional regulator, repressor for deo operon, udp, cdd, tsx, nupC, and nupG
MENSGRNPKKRVTSYDVAQFVGISQSTVSRVLNGKGLQYIGLNTRNRVFEAARQLGYSPDPIARALRGKRTNLIGIIVRDISDPFFADFVAVLSTEARFEGYHIILGHAQSDPAQALEMSSVLDTGHCDGVIVLGDLRDDEEAMRQLLGGNRPLVAVCRGQSPGWIPTVNSDNTAGMRMLIDHLVGLGHRRIAFINGGWLGDMRDRNKIFEEYLCELSITLPPEYMLSEMNDADGGYRAMCKLLKLAPRPTAVCVADDMMAMGALLACHDAGLRVPEDISLTGFDDIQISRFAYPRLTTIRQHVDEMGSQVLKLLIDLIAQNDIEESRKSIQVQPELVIRESTGPVPHNAGENLPV